MLSTTAVVDAVRPPAVFGADMVFVLDGRKCGVGTYVVPYT